jgi:hypothetical protein
MSRRNFREANAFDRSPRAPRAFGHPEYAVALPEAAASDR